MGDTLNRGAGCHPQSFCPDLLLQARSSEPALPLPVCFALSHPILASFFRKTLPLLWSTSGARCGPHIPSSSPPFSLVYATRHDTLAGSRFPPWLLSSAQSVPPYVVSCHCPGSHLCPWWASSNAIFSIWKFLHGCFRKQALNALLRVLLPPTPISWGTEFHQLLSPLKIDYRSPREVPICPTVSFSCLLSVSQPFLCSSHDTRHICLGTLWSHPAPDSLTLCPLCLLRRL